MNVAAPPVETDRTEFFSDGVLAIVITLLAVEIHRPEVEPGGLAHALVEGWPRYLAYMLSFLYVGVIWLNHNGLFRHLRRVDRAFNWINFGVLGTTTLMPFATGVLATSFETGDRTDQQSAVVAYALIAGLMSAAWLPVFPYLRRHPELLRAPESAALFAAQRVRPVVGVTSFASAAALGWFVHPLLAIAIFVLMLGYHAWTSEGVRPAQEVEVSSEPK
jgi:uncharacterized membrane protein